MVFSSIPFLCLFLPAVVVLYLFARTIFARNILLVCASLIFYAYGEPVYVVLMILSTLVNYVFARVVGSARDSGRHRSSNVWLALSVAVNLGLLGVFKYAGMAVETLNAITGLALTVPDAALPLGISFYTFQAISYVVDVHRGTVGASRNYLNVLLFISFFPQLVAGPIVKYHDIADQIRARNVTAAKMASGARRFAVGLGKKVLIANTMAVAADAMYASTGDWGITTLGAWIAALAYLMQIYFDFSGYSDMAIGLARMFGFELKENFDHPYESRTIKEFWRRWHISLSTWFKEYLYIPLGGNRKGRVRANLNRIIIFFFCGLWHGASWTFVVWGLFHGLFLLLEDYVPLKRLPSLLGHVYTLLVVAVGFVIFRADTLDQAGMVIAAMFGFGSGGDVAASIAMQQLSGLFVAAFIAAVIGSVSLKRPTLALAGRLRLGAAVTGASYVATIVLLVVCLLELSSGSYNPFIYFRF